MLIEITILLAEDEDCTMTVSQVVEVYTQSFFLRGSEDIVNSIDFIELDNLLWNMREDFKAKDAFNILEMHSRGTLKAGEENSLPAEITRI